jgi:hypothetical protein
MAINLIFMGVAFRSLKVLSTFLVMKNVKRSKKTVYFLGNESGADFITKRNFLMVSKQKGSQRRKVFKVLNKEGR